MTRTRRFPTSVIVVAAFLASCTSSAETTAATSPATSAETTSMTAAEAVTTTAVAAPGTSTVWQGSVDDRAPFTLRLSQEGPWLRGEIRYDAGDGAIDVFGSLQPSGDGNWFLLHEFLPDGDITGTMTFRYDGGDELLDLTWDGLASTATLAATEDGFSFEPLTEPASFSFQFPPFGDDGADDAGDDEADTGASGWLQVDDLDGGTATIELLGIRGAPSYNLAVVDPTVVPFDGTRAVYELRDDFFDCAFEIVLFADVAYVEHLDDRWECGFGNGAGVEGIYARDGRTTTGR